MAPFAPAPVGIHVLASASRAETRFSPLLTGTWDHPRQWDKLRKPPAADPAVFLSDFESLPAPFYVVQQGLAPAR